MRPCTCNTYNTYTVELGVVIGKKGRDIPPTDVSDHIKGYFLGLDMTAREIQDQAKKKGTSTYTHTPIYIEIHE